MKNFFKSYKKIIIILCSILLAGLLAVVLINRFMDENTLTVEERAWIDENKGTVVNVNVTNDANIMASYGSGVFYDFINSFSSNYAELEINPITSSYENEISGLSFTYKTEMETDDILFLEDHYVILTKEIYNYENYEELTNLTIGVAKSDETLLKSGLNDSSIEFTTYENREALLTAFEAEVTHIAVPLNLYLDEILSKNLNIAIHLSDINGYYVMEPDGSIISNILVKYFNGTWNEELYNSVKTNEFNIFSSNLNITEADIDKLRSVVHTYGFTTNSPYEIISSGEFGGISAVFIKEFSDFAGIDFEFEKYDNYSDLINALDKKEVDIYLNDFNNKTEYINTTTGISLDYEIIALTENDIVIKSLEALNGNTVYVEKNSLLYDFLNKITGVKIKTFEDEKELLKLSNEDVLIMLDNNSFLFYKSNGLEDFTSRYSGSTNSDINYALKNNDTMYLLLDNYLKVTDNSEVVNRGIHNHEETVKMGNLLSMLARYIIILVILGSIVAYILVKKSKKIKIAKKIKKDDKMKFIDQLTSLKNRNYLNECIESWNNNTIYPQTLIVVDLNDIQKINDIHGYNEGDRQIKSFANAIIKTQLDNSEIMRTDGNEFVIYLIGYSQKQITNYIHKLNKEVEKLPFENGAKFGYSMILDNLKTIEDCLNEASNDMKAKKKNG